MFWRDIFHWKCPLWQTTHRLLFQFVVFPAMTQWHPLRPIPALLVITYSRPYNYFILDRNVGRDSLITNYWYAAILLYWRKTFYWPILSWAGMAQWHTQTYKIKSKEKTCKWLAIQIEILERQWSVCLSVAETVNRMAWQWAETLVEIRETLADIRGTTKYGCRCQFPKYKFNRSVCLEAHHYLMAQLSQ